MRRRHGLLALLFFAFFAGGATSPATARAQTAVAPDPAPIPAVKRDTSATAAVALALKTVTDAAAAETEVDGLLEAATKAHDVVKANFLTEKKSQVAAVLRIARDRRKLIVAAAGRGDNGIARRLAEVLPSLSGRIDELKTQAHEAIGKKAAQVAVAKKPAANATVDEMHDDDADAFSSRGSPGVFMFWLPKGAFAPPGPVSPTK